MKAHGHSGKDQPHCTAGRSFIVIIISYFWKQIYKHEALATVGKQSQKTELPSVAVSGCDVLL